MLLKIFFSAAFGLLAFCATSAASAQAFGIEPGTPIARLNVKESLGSNLYSISVPQPNNAFESYTVVATPGAGVCKIRGIGLTLRQDRTGAQVRRVFGDLSSALTARYGAPRNYDHLVSGALWDGYNEWASALRQNERTYQSFWMGNDVNLPSNIAGISLEAKAVSLTDTYVVLEYEFANFDACKAEINRVNNRGL